MVGKRVALYVRVSSEEQKRHGISVDSQITALREYSEEHRHIVVGLYNDAGISARKKYTRRPALLKLVDDCKAGRVDLILFTKLDRWFRSVSDYYEVQRVLDQCKVPWRAIWEDYETETSGGVFKVNIMLSVAQAESDRTSERIKAVNEFRRARGDYVGGRAPTGYKVEGPKLLIDPGKQKGVRAMFDTYLATMSPMEAVVTGRAHGLNIDIDSVRRILRHPAYAGDCHGYRCEPYITVDQHQQIVASLEARTRLPKDAHRVYLFAGLLRCSECGGLLNGRASSYISVTGTELTYKYYRCRNHITKKNCVGCCISERKMERFLLRHIEEALSTLRVARLESEQNEMVGAQKTIAALKARLTRVGDRYEDGDMDRDEYRTKRDTIRAEIAALEQQMEPTRELPELPEGWKSTYAALDEPYKKAFWRKTINKVVVFRDKQREPEIIF